MNTPKQTPLVDILRLHAEDLHNDYGHNKSARLLSQAADEIERLRSSALALEDEKNDYMDGVGDVLRQDHDGETLWAAAQRVMSERDRLRTDNTGLLTVLDRMLTTLRYLIGIAERGEGHPIGGIEMQNILLIDRDDEPTGALLDRLRAAEAEVERLRCNAMQWRKPGPVTAEHPLDCLIVIPALRQADGDWWIRGSEFLEGDAPIAWCADTSIARAALAQYGIVDRQEDAA